MRLTTKAQAPLYKGRLVYILSLFPSELHILVAPGFPVA